MTRTKNERNQDYCQRFTLSFLRLLHSSNLPKEVMLFPEFPFPDNVPSFFHHSGVLKYLEDYASHYNLEQYIRFETKMLNVKSLPDTTCANPLDTLWNVQ